jgi:tetratricopeptide (TPR) repeat protein
VRKIPNKLLDYYEQTLVILREVEDRSGEGATLNNLGLVYDDLGNKQDALHYFEQALVIRREVGDRSGKGITLCNISSLFFRQQCHVSSHRQSRF